MRKQLLAPLALAALVAAVYLPRLPRGFVHWDDDFLIARNARLTLAPRDLAWMFGSFGAQTYQPLGWLAYALLGADPARVHAALLAVHAANAGLLVSLLGALGCAPAAAWLAAAAWALHPLMVESAAWATELPDVLATAFYLAALLAWVRKKPRWTLALFAASCLSRWKGVNLPVVLLLLDYARLKRWVWRDKLPVFAVAAASLAVNAAAKAGLSSMDLFGTLRHPLAAAAAVSFYIGKLLVPLGLMPLYFINAPGAPVAGPAFAAAALTAGLFFLRRRAPSTFGAWLGYLTAILPTCYAATQGLVVAMDHYAYLATLPLFYPLAVALGRLKPARAAALSAPVLLLLAALSFGRLSAWQDSVALWTSALETDPSSCPALSNLGEIYYEGGQREAALLLFGREVFVCPDNEVTRHHRALLERAR